MIIDFRYHIASLVAVFIALGVGIFIGSTLVGEDIAENLVREQRNWIGKLEADYINLKKETQELSLQLAEKETEIKKYNEFLSEIKPLVISGKLTGKKFGLIALEKSPLTPEIIRLLEQSGANTVLINSNKQLSDLMEFNKDLAYLDSQQLDGIIIMANHTLSKDNNIFDIKNLKNRYPVYIIKEKNVENMIKMDNVFEITNLKLSKEQISFILSLTGTKE